MTYKTFDFEMCGYGCEHKEWLRENCHVPMTEEEFVKAWQGIKKERWSPSTTRCNYRTLKNKFGFFI